MIAATDVRDIDLGSQRHVRVVTVGANRPGKPVLMIHGFRGDHHGLLPIARAMERHPGIIIDLPGFGESSPLPVSHTVEAYAQFVNGLPGLIREHLDIELGEAPALFGHSFGSVITSRAVAEDPSRWGDLTLLNPLATPALAGPKSALSKLIALYYRAGAVLPEPLGRALLGNRLIVRAMSETMTTTDDQQVRHWIHDQHRQYFSHFADSHVVEEVFNASISNTVSDVAERLTLPVQLIAGDVDDVAPLPGQHALLDKLPQGQLSVITGVGHLTHYETPVVVADLVEAFLDGNSSSNGPSLDAQGRRV